MVGVLSDQNKKQQIVIDDEDGTAGRIKSR